MDPKYKNLQGFNWTIEGEKKTKKQAPKQPRKDAPKKKQSRPRELEGPVHEQGPPRHFYQPRRAMSYDYYGVMRGFYPQRSQQYRPR